MVRLVGRFSIILLAIFSTFLGPGGCVQSTEQHRLAEFNHAKPWDGVSADELDHDLVRRYQGKPFQCSRAADHTPEETPVAARAFADFVKYSAHGDSVPDFWMNESSRHKRKQLLADAVEAGSWKAAYVDAVWAFHLAEDNATMQRSGNRLASLVKRGIPIAAYTYATYLDQAPGEQDRLLNEAIIRGSPDAMAVVGGTMVVRSRKLRPVGKAMLECALSQGNADAYASLGKIADMEGREVDAYKLWEKGVNSGCRDCLDHMLAVAKVRPGYTSATPRGDLVPELKAIQNFLDKSSLYEWTRLPELATPLPSNLSFHVSDAELLKLLELQAKMRDVGN